MNMCFITSRFIAERPASELQNPASLLLSYHRHVFHSLGHRGDLGTLCSVCTRWYPCPEDRSGCPRPALSHTFLVRGTSEPDLEHFLWKHNRLWLLRQTVNTTTELMFRIFFFRNSFEFCSSTWKIFRSLLFQHIWKHCFESRVTKAFILINQDPFRHHLI